MKSNSPTNYISIDELPLVRLLLPLLLGIVCYAYFPEWQYAHQLGIGVLVLTIMAYAWRSLRSSYKYRAVWGLLLFFCWASLGYIRTQQHDQYHQGSHFRYHVSQSDEQKFVRFRLLEPPLEKAKSHQLKVEVQAVYDSLDRYATSGKAIIYLQKDSLVSQLQYGDVLIAPYHFKPIQEALNPNAFDYKSYLAQSNIHHQAYLKSGEWSYLNQNEGHAIFHALYQLRRFCQQSLAQYIHDPDALAVASALSLGDKRFLHVDLQQTYAHTGAMHVLAVSGLHVGIIWGVLNAFLFPLARMGRIGRSTKTLLLLIGVWIYALLTALPPSVFRAAVMFSFLIVGLSLKRYTNTYNIIAGSALCLLLWNPFLLWQVGFQLSYTAVVGIIYFQPKIYQLLDCKSYATDWAWQLSSVSVAAQLGTLPLSLYYFHQLPTYALLSNLIVIPAATLTLSLAMLLFTTCILPISAGISQLIGDLLSYLLQGQNYLLFQLSQLPQATWGNCNWQHWEALLAYLLLFLFASFLQFRFRRALQLCLLLVVFWIGNSAFGSKQQLQQEQFRIYHLPKSSAIAQVNGREATVWTRDALSQKDFNYNIKPDLQSLGIWANIKQHNTCQASTYPLLHFHDHHLLIIDQSWHPDQLAEVEQHKITHILLQNNPKVQLESLSCRYPKATFIADASNKYWRVKKWTVAAQKEQIPFHDMRVEGAFIF